MKLFLRNSLAKAFRSIPSFRGKSKLASLLIPLLTNYQIDEECIVTIQMRDGTTMEIDLRNFEKNAFFTGEYDYPLIQKLLRLLKPNCTVLDVGSNIGFYSIALGNQLKKKFYNSKILSFEPIKSNFERLNHLVRANHLDDIIYSFNLALGNQEGEFSFHLENEANSKTGNAFLVINPSLISTNSMAHMTKLDDFSRLHDINECTLIKVDIEGGELDFFLGGANFIATHHPVILSEFNSYFAQQLGYSFVDFLNLMKSYGYDLYLYERLKNKFVSIKLEDEFSETSISNILMIPQGDQSDSILTLLNH